MTDPKAAAEFLEQAMARMERGLTGIDDLDLADHLPVELFASNRLGQLWLRAQVSGIGDEGEAKLDRILLEHLHRRADPAAVAVLAAISTLAGDAKVRRAADIATMRLGKLGVPVPAWHGEPLTVTECWRTGDVFGDERIYLMVFDGPSGPHAAAMRYEFSVHLGDTLTALTVTRNVDWIRERIWTEANAGPSRLTPFRVEPTTVVSDASYALMAFEGEQYPDPAELPDGVLDYRAILMARLRLLSDAPPWLPGEVADSEIERVMQEFLTENPGRLDLSQTGLQAIYYTVRHHIFGGLRVSPVSLHVFLFSWLESQLDRGDPIYAAVPAVVETFIPWAARRTRLPEHAVAALAEDAAGMLDDYRADHLGET